MKRRERRGGASDPSLNVLRVVSLPGCAHVGTTEHRSVARFSL